jgi:hypothetical protein
MTRIEPPESSINSKCLMNCGKAFSKSWRCASLKIPLDVCPVGQKMQSFPLLYQTGAKLRRDVAFQPPAGTLWGDGM